MSYPIRFTTVRVAAIAATVLGAAALTLLLRSSPVQAQGPMSAPACQCSAPTAISGMSSRVAHCMCGAMSCVIAEPSDSARGTSQMQCVRQ